jgi:diguanylate cyclase (GGDEF)-like protein
MGIPLMEHSDAQHQARADRKPWLALLGLLTVLALLFWTALAQNLDAERRAAREAGQQELELTARVLAAPLQAARRQDIQPLVDALGRADPDVRRIRVTAADGASLGIFTRASPAGPREVMFSLQSTIPDASSGQAVLDLDLGSAGIEARHQRLLTQTAALFAVFALLLTALVHFALRLRNEARDLQRRSVELEIARAQASSGVQRLRELNRTLTLLQRCNEALVRATGERELVDAMCDLLVDLGGYTLAWIGYIDDQPERDIHLTASAGQIAYLEGIRLSWADTAIGQGPTGRSIRAGAPIWIRDTRSDPGFAPWCERAERFGIRSSIALPLGSGAACLGVICIYATVPSPVSEEELTLLSGLANDVAYGIQALRSAEALRESKDRLHQIAENIREVFWMIDLPKGHLLYVSRAYETIWQRPLDELYADPESWLRSIHPDDRLNVELSSPHGSGRAVTEGPETGAVNAQEYRIIRPDGTQRWIRERCFPVRDEDGQVYRIAGTAEDVTERKAYEAQLEHQAYHDLLTGLANRRLLGVRMEQALAHARRHRHCVAVAVLDLDRFKLINDSQGHEIGDELLRQVSDRLRAATRATDIVARLGGDEFVLVLGEQQSVESGMQALRQVQEVISRPYRLSDIDVPVSCSIGVAFHPEDAADPAALLRCADAAMYLAKDEGKNSIRAFSPELHQRVTERVRLETSLREALTAQQFRLVYQAKVDAHNGVIVGAEALIRWHHPELGVIAPDRFIPIAEDTLLIVDIGAWVLHTACAQMQAWHAAGLCAIPISVNLAPRQFRDRALPQRIEQALSRSGLPARYLDLEITESTLLEHTEDTLLMLRQLRKLGLQISIDDFGTGYSSIAYLKRFQPNRLKIDRCFVSDLPEDVQDATIAKLIITMAHSLGMQVVAEGVETAAQLAFLRSHQCDEVQGFLFCRPVDAAEFGALLAQSRLTAEPFGDLGLAPDAAREDPTTGAARVPATDPDGTRS